MRGELKLDTRAFGPSATIIDIVRETLLTRVEVDCGYALTRLKEGDSNVQRRRGFARAAFLVAKDDDVRRLSCFLDRLDQHAVPSGSRFSKY